MKSLFLLLALSGFSLLNMPVVMATGQLKIVSEDIQIVRAEFGLFKQDNAGNQSFVPAKTVPLVEGQEYGWMIVLKTKKPTIKWREEFTLPYAPATWGDVEAQGLHTVSTDGRISVMEREISPVDGLVFNSWTVAAGDPQGRYVMRVLIDNRYEQIFEFYVQPVIKHQSTN
jgi:hypothetical protein